MNAFELHTAFKIETPFKDWAEAQIKAGKGFKPFFGKLPDGKLGKNYTLSPELVAELIAQHEAQAIEQLTQPHPQPARAKVWKPKARPAKPAPKDETPYSVLNYNETVFNRALSDKQARKAGIALSYIGRAKGIEPGKQDHPVWGQVNTWPRWMLDRYYRNSLANMAVDPDHQQQTEAA
ncbi:MAG: hypothetical protein WAW61_13075 [Methylococcaceae bacterium]